MFISVTQLKLKSIFKFVPFAILNFKVVKQLAKAPGLLKQHLRATDPYTYWTLTVWKDKNSMIQFRNNGPHLEAMKNISKIANKTKAGSWETDTLPDWKEAMQKIDTHASRY